MRVKRDMKGEKKINENESGKINERRGKINESEREKSKKKKLA